MKYAKYGMQQNKANLRPVLLWRFKHPTSFANYLGIVRVVSLAVLVLIGWLDYITGYEFGFFIFYFIPVAIAAWYCSPKDGICCATACAVCWYFSDRFTHHPYSRAYFIYWEMFIRLISFLTTAMTLSKIRELVLSEEQMNAELFEIRCELAKYTGDGDTNNTEPSLPDSSKNNAIDRHE